METERLFLRKFTKEDGMDLYEYLSREAVVKYEPYHVYTKEAAFAEAKRRSEDEQFLAVELKSTGKVIGNLYMCKQKPEEMDTWEIGYVFHDDYWGHGYASEAARCLVEYLFKKCNAHRVVAHCTPKNVRSYQLLERIGMRKEALEKQKIFFFRDEKGEPIWHDALTYAMLKEDLTLLKEDLN